MKTAVAAAVEPRTIAHTEDLAHLLWPNPGPYFCLVELDGQASTGETFYRLRDGRWSEPGPYPPGQEPTLREAIIAASNSWRMRLSPFLNVAGASSSIAQFDCLVAFVNLPKIDERRRAHVPFNAADQLMAAMSGMTNEFLVDDEARAEAVAAITGMSPQPNILLDEGERLACIWLLYEPRRESELASFDFGKSKAVYTMQRLAVKLGQSGAFAHRPHLIRIDCVGVKHPTIKHVLGEKRLPHTVSALLLHENRYRFDDLEEASK
jgi:hypothetical protein